MPNDLMIVGQEDTRRHLGKRLSGGTSGIMGILRRGGHSWSAPHHRPAVRLEIFGDVPFAPVLVTSLGGRSLMAPPPLLHPTVENHVHGLVGEGMLEVREPRRFRVRDDEEQQSHQSPPPNHGLPSTPSRPGSVARLQRRSTRPSPLTQVKGGSGLLYCLYCSGN